MKLVLCALTLGLSIASVVAQECYATVLQKATSGGTCATQSNLDAVAYNKCLCEDREFGYRFREVARNIIECSPAEAYAAVISRSTICYAIYSENSDFYDHKIEAQASVYYNRGLSNSSLSEEEKALAFHDLALTDLYSLRVVQSARLNQDYHQVTLRLGGSSNSGLYNTDVAYYLINQMMQHATDITSFSLSPFISRASAIPQEFLSHAVLDWSILYLPNLISLNIVVPALASAALIVPSRFPSLTSISFDWQSNASRGTGGLRDLLLASAETLTSLKLRGFRGIEGSDIILPSSLISLDLDNTLEGMVLQRDVLPNLKYLTVKIEDHNRVIQILTFLNSTRLDSLVLDGKIGTPNFVIESVSQLRKMILVPSLSELKSMTLDVHPDVWTLELKNTIDEAKEKRGLVITPRIACMEEWCRRFSVLDWAKYSGEHKARLLEDARALEDSRNREEDRQQAKLMLAVKKSTRRQSLA